MIRVNISEIKNRLSHYLRLVRGGEEIEILDRKTPLARIVHVSQAGTHDDETPWIKDVEHLGIVMPPRKKGFPRGLLTKGIVAPRAGKVKRGVLEALLEERSTGR